MSLRTDCIYILVPFSFFSPFPTSLYSRSGRSGLGRGFWVLGFGVVLFRFKGSFSELGGGAFTT